MRSRLQFLFEDEYVLNYLKRAEKCKGQFRTISSVSAEDGSSLNGSESVLKGIRAVYAQPYSGKNTDAGARGTLSSIRLEASVEDQEQTRDSIIS